MKKTTEVNDAFLAFCNPSPLVLGKKMAKAKEEDLVLIVEGLNEIVGN